MLFRKNRRGDNYPDTGDLDTHDLMQPLEAIQKRGTIDVALRVQNYLQSIMREAALGKPHFLDHPGNLHRSGLSGGQNFFLLSH
ncbi:hypothetical protein HK44_019360 [Pseudomonas fluorescens HK44]|uniref:Uncharacterized protein n=1 Tax=Pseudomonas fluorescens HK44 TaxID=1042209 RepID=A0A010REW9_PSEFL|nr:hypothetical protein HK44_019360 [Pseudomonas fluorescens HK44]